ncbi:MAG: hypothetical protein R3B49_05925 [Phycisphaerales bacterium]
MLVGRRSTRWRGEGRAAADLRRASGEPAGRGSHGEILAQPYADETVLASIQQAVLVNGSA